MNILWVEVVNVDVIKDFYVWIYNLDGDLIVEKGMKGGINLDLVSECVFDNEKCYMIMVILY